jgi:hypothetical protein
MKKIDKEVRSTVDLSYFHQAAMGETKLFVQGVMCFPSSPRLNLPITGETELALGGRIPNTFLNFKFKRNFKVGGINLGGRLGRKPGNSAATDA